LGQNAESGDQLGIRAAAVDISLFRFTKIFLSADDVPHECRRRRRERTGQGQPGLPLTFLKYYDFQFETKFQSRSALAVACTGRLCGSSHEI
jgi:hypothetical protein